MIYRFNKNNYSNFNVYSENKLASRAYFIPFPSRKEADKPAYIDERYSSPLVRVLNGEWDFKYYNKPSEMPLEFDTDSIDFDKVPVPSMWQYTGYDKPYYTNQKYIFRLQPPRIPELEPVGKYPYNENGRLYSCDMNIYNSVGVYRTKIEVTDTDKEYIISFLGVASCLEIYLNGEYVGYSEGSHNTAEFLLKGIRQGSNELVAIVRRWCNGSYLEAQDMFRSNGIFRDVLLYEQNKANIRDFRFSAKKKGKNYTVDLNVVTCGCQSEKVNASLERNGKVVWAGIVDNSTHFELEAPVEWNAEQPELYDLYISLSDNDNLLECIKTRVGFKDVKVEGEVFKINSKAVKLKGVNHHDTTMDKGYYMTPDELVRDVKLMKEYNVNTVRTSHYPPDPLFLRACAEEGLYVIDEADIETHGCASRPKYNMNLISNNLKWKDHYLDRVSAMVCRDYNNPAIIMWSLGNESGGYKCQDYCYSWLKGLNTGIPIHYEGVIHTKRMAYDVVSEMYAEISHIKRIAEGRAYWEGIKSQLLKKAIIGYHKIFFPMDFTKLEAYSGRPYFLCEYAHAMGLGPGGLEEYWDVIYSSEKMMGGCIWEWADHAVKRRTDESKWEYSYGGDHAEPVHDSNFCVDGLMFPDRRPHTGAMNMKEVYAPIRATYKNHVLNLHNTNSFCDSSYMDIVYSICVDGVRSAEYKLDRILLSGERVDIPIACESNGDVRVRVECTNKKDGKTISCRDFSVNENIGGYNIAPDTLKPSNINGLYMYDFKNGKIGFCKDGRMVSLVIEGKEIFTQEGGADTNIFRAPIDNDMYIKKSWFKSGYKDYTVKTVNVAFNAGNVVRESVMVFEDKELFRVKDIYTISSSGDVGIKSEIEPISKGLPILPRIGKKFTLSKNLENVRYYGRGEGESYPDLKAQTVVGIFQTKSDAMTQPHIRPQESGSRANVRWAEIFDKDGVGIRLNAVDKPLHFGCKSISDKVLSECAHLEDVIDSGVIHLDVDGFMGGIGTNSCGPMPTEEYRLNADKKYVYEFIISPLCGNK